MYTKFKLGSVHEKYPLTLTGFTLKSGDLMASANGRKFSTPDADNDHTGYHCAPSYSSGWWYYSSYHELNINRKPPNVGGTVLFTEMKIRQKTVCQVIDLRYTMCGLHFSYVIVKICSSNLTR